MKNQEYSIKIINSRLFSRSRTIIGYLESYTLLLMGLFFIFVLPWSIFNTKAILPGPSMIFFIGLMLAFISVLIWPTVPCSIKINKDKIVFNSKSATRLFNPKRQLLISDIRLCIYLESMKEKTKEIHITVKDGQKITINVSGAKNRDIEELINVL